MELESSIDTDRFSAALRARVIDVKSRRLLITNFHGSKQEQDLTEPPNCNGFGRVRHFCLAGNSGWPQNPLPIEPARRALHMRSLDQLRAQVFQISACNWRCWYCFVDRTLLSANLKHASLLAPSELVDLYLQEASRPQVIDLTGGQPDLAPEWILWMMQELKFRGLENDTYIWSDDNLSIDYFWHFLTDKDREVICKYKNYGKVCCFKGFDAVSFAFNSSALPECFCQAKTDPFDDRKCTHLRGLAGTLTTEKRPI